ncbi:MAG: PAQR family membrane homeostasis protein TrhA [Bacteroidota bacterium]
MNSPKRFTKKEELANAISHGFGAIFGLTALILMIIFASRKGSSLHVVSLTIYGSTLFVLFLSSTLNHSLKPGKARDFFHNFDQIAIYLLIAGTYTPLALVGLRGDWGWVLFGIEWGLALTGIIIKSILPNKFEKGVSYFTIISFILMGWMLLFFIIPFLRQLPTEAIILIFAGGILFTGGTVFFKMEKIKYNHLIWHLFVIGGSVLHFMAIFKFLIPWNK